MNITSLLLIAFAAIVSENFVFTHYFGICPFLGVSDKPSKAFGMGAIVTFVITLSSVLTWLLDRYVLNPFSLTYLTTVLFITVIAVLVQAVELFIKKKSPALHEKLGIYLPLTATNCAVLEATLLNIQNGFNLLEAIVFGFASAIGFTLALLIFAGVRERLIFSNPPKAFEGLPILLISAGLIAMAFSGLSGINIG